LPKLTIPLTNLNPGYFENHAIADSAFLTHKVFRRITPSFLTNLTERKLATSSCGRHSGDLIAFYGNHLMVEKLTRHAVEHAIGSNLYGCFHGQTFYSLDTSYFSALNRT
jgi:hypothetical protein